MEFNVLIGMDWADQSHQISMRVAGSKEVERAELKQTPETIQEWVGDLRRRFGDCKIAVALEQRRGALIYTLMKYEIFVIFPLNTTAVKNYRKALRASGAKDDVSDADLQLLFLENHMDQLRRWNPETVRTRKLSLLSESRRKLVDEATAVSNQITALLKEYYPIALLMVGNLTTLMACDFLTRWPNLAKLKRARAMHLQRFYALHNCRNSKAIEQRIGLAAGAQPLLEENEMIEAYSLMLSGRVTQMKALLGCIAQMEEEIEETYKTHPDAEIYDSFPGAGRALAPRIAVALGEDRTKFDSAVAILNLTGVAPVTIASGKVKRVAFRMAAPKFQRQTFIEFARVSVQHSRWARSDYQIYRKAGMSHQAAIRRIAYKWIRIIYRCWKDRTLYDETKYEVSRAIRANKIKAS